MTKEDVVKTQKGWPHVRALYSQPQSTASAENEIKSQNLSLSHPLSLNRPLSLLFLLLFKKFN